MRDRQTSSIWYHMTGEAVSGPARGARLEMLPLVQMTWAEWRKVHPDTFVLSDDTPYRSQYRTVARGTPLLDPGVEQQAMSIDRRLAPNALVLGVDAGTTFRAYPLAALKDAATQPAPVQEDLDGHPIVVFYDPAGNAALAFARYAEGGAVYLPGPLSFGHVPGASGAAGAAGEPIRFRNEETQSTWTVEGRAIHGPLAGAQLRYVPSFTGQWYGWSAYHPTTTIWGSPEALASVAPGTSASPVTGRGAQPNPIPPAMQACVRQALGDDAYGQIGSGGRLPTAAERQAAQVCQQPPTGR